jgi:hypothetical protein
VAGSWPSLKSATFEKLLFLTQMINSSRSRCRNVQKTPGSTYFFKSAVQFVTTVMGSVPPFTLPLLIRNFFPSAVTT